MKNMINQTAVCIMLCLGFQAVSQQSPEITGSVVDPAGQNVANAGIELLELQGPDINSIRRTMSAKDGTFHFSSLSPGKYRLYVWSDDYGVPYSRAVLLQQTGQIFPEVQVPLESTSKTVVISLPLPFGMLTGHIIDAQSGKPVPHARIRLNVIGEPGIMYSTDPRDDGSYLLRLPERLIGLSISAPGYQNWVFHSNDGTEGLLLKQGLKMNIDVRLVH